jgi:hypothetical protein
MTPTPPLHAQVLALRRTQSARAEAQALSIPLGTVKAISSRAGRRFGKRCIPGRQVGQLVPPINQQTHWAGRSRHSKRNRSLPTRRRCLANPSAT